jgi:hypothetical protein
VRSLADVTFHSAGTLPYIALHTARAIPHIALHAPCTLAGPFHVSRGRATRTQPDLSSDVPLDFSRARHHQLNAIAVQAQGTEHERNAKREQDQRDTQHHRDNQ